MSLFKIFGKTHKELVDEAFAKYAELDGELAEQAALIDLYGELVGTIDPHQDWWSFAHAKEALHNAGVEYNAIRVKVDAQRARCEILIHGSKAEC